MESSQLPLGIVLFAVLFSIEGAAGYPSNLADYPITPLGIVSPTPNSCYTADTATFSHMEVTGCTEQPCSINSSYTYEIAAWITPGHSTNSMQYRITFDAGTAEHSFGTLSLTKAYYAGSLYRISREVEFPYSLNGKTGEVRVLLFEWSGLYHASRCFQVTVNGP
ncbi:uncharacterized protein LOC110850195 [Folsomia candida]|uniref:MD-2-related lipid-recognition domain-containing protein n=1 Tax=Folsomia candida TaxID=158441 RepID=A0A226EAE6_FOLCA|nr:uncharacterized protein LOC110850195 [Folsomia candida]OXA54188.1 hypothetical protein Fcan01_10576 [Folsomia candida]